MHGNDEVELEALEAVCGIDYDVVVAKGIEFRSDPRRLVAV